MSWALEISFHYSFGLTPNCCSPQEVAQITKVKAVQGAFWLDNRLVLFTMFCEKGNS